LNTKKQTRPLAGRPLAGFLAAGSVALLALTGCEDKAEIRTYTTPKEIPGVVDAAPVRAAATGEEPVHWSMPEGWTRQAGDEFRFATLTDARTDPALTVTVSKLPARAGTLLANVNRWRGQLALDPIDEAQLVEQAHPLEGVSLPSVLVDLVMAEPEEEGGPEPMRMLAAVYETPGWTWFFKSTAPRSQMQAREAELLSIYRSVHLDSAGGHGTPAPASATPASATPLLDPAAASPLGAPVIVSAPSDEPLIYTVPEGWREDSTPRTARLATILIGQDAVLAEMAITRFPGDVGGELANVNRWRGQLGLPAIGSIDAEGGIDVQINGNPGRVYRIVGPGEGDLQTGILVAFVERDGHIWFFKTVGPIDVLDTHRDRFDAFLSSIKFQGG
jgi:hypothetical protein